MRMAEQQLHGVERVALCYQTACKRPAATVAAMTDTETSGTVQTWDIALETVGRGYSTVSPSKLTRRLTLSSNALPFCVRISRVWGVRPRYSRRSRAAPAHRL
jgi:hypothetical protein